LLLLLPDTGTLVTVALGFANKDRFHELLLEDHRSIVLPFLGEVELLLGCLCCGLDGGAWYCIMGQSKCGSTGLSGGVCHKGALVLGCSKMMSSSSVVSSAIAVSESKH